MTSNQIAYWKNVETERANKAQESLTKDSNLIKQYEAQTKAGQLNELKRANLVTEALARDTLQEKKAADIADYIAKVGGTLVGAAMRLG